MVVLDGHRHDDYDVESTARRQLKGNIYLAKVTRVEPSLQAAFVEYGGNRHGFLAFSEIHPDYFQIPVADRQALQAAEVDEEPDQDEDIEPEGENDGQHVETLGGTDVEEVAYRRRPSVNPRNYKIQEVIKRRQILLVQVVKEERGNKGAALTTYISLAGRYCVLMPNTPRGGGVSRKIANGADRNRLKTILGDLEIPNGMAVIVRTAGAKRSKSEIKRDHEYLTRLWDTIRRTTLESIAPTLVHEEANLIRRSIRDMYTRDMDNIIVEGDPGYRAAKGFMKLLIPSHAKKVQPYRDNAISLFHAHGVENQIDGIHNAEVQLKSGGYIVINPTEALVSVDVNSGKSTRERNIEETALRTNLEAAEVPSLPGGWRVDRHRLHRHGGQPQQRAGGAALEGNRARPGTHSNWPLRAAIGECPTTFAPAIETSAPPAILRRHGEHALHRQFGASNPAPIEKGLPSPSRKNRRLCFRPSRSTF